MLHINPVYRGNALTGARLQVRSDLQFEILQTIQEKGAKLLGPPHHVRLQYYPLSIRPAVVIGPVPQ